jgi:hypothetical protein
MLAYSNVTVLIFYVLSIIVVTHVLNFFCGSNQINFFCESGITCEAGTFELLMDLLAKWGLELCMIHEIERP